MRTRSSWGLDIGSSALKMARIDDAGGRMSVQTFGPVALPTELGPSLHEALSHGLNALFSSAGIKRSSVTTAIPRSLATIKFPLLPRTTPQQMAQMVRFEAQRYVPFPIEDVVISFQELPRHARMEVTAQGSGDQAELLLTAVRRDTISEFRQAVTSAGGYLTHLSVSTLGIWNLLHHALPPASDEEAIVVLDLGGRSSTVVAFHQGEMVFNRSISMGGDNLTGALVQSGLDRGSAEVKKRDSGITTLSESSIDSPLARIASPEEEWAMSLASEIRRSLAALRGERRNLRVERLHLVGGGAKTPGIAAYLEASLDLPTDLLDVPGLLPDPQFAEAVGLALGSLGYGISSIDLVLEEFERTQRKRRDAMKMRLAVVAGTAILAAAVLFGIDSLQAQQEVALRIERARQSVDAAELELKNARQDYERLTQQALILETALRPKNTWLDVLQDISNRAPRGVWVSGIDLEKGRAFNLRGTALTQGDVQAFWSNLSRSPLLVRPNLPYANRAQIAERDVFQFGITGDIAGNEPKPTKPQKKKGGSRVARAAK